jgi:serine/threonine protein kinase
MSRNWLFVGGLSKPILFPTAPVDTLVCPTQRTFFILFFFFSLAPFPFLASRPLMHVRAFWPLPLAPTSMFQVTKAFENMTDAKRILREIKLLRMFRHDNIMSITDLFPPPHQKGPKDLTDLYIVSDLMDTDL